VEELEAGTQGGIGLEEPETEGEGVSGKTILEVDAEVEGEGVSGKTILEVDAEVEGLEVGVPEGTAGVDGLEELEGVPEGTAG
jgi:hypothetical protein